MNADTTPSERWSKVQETFDTAADLPPAKRRRFLDEACAGDSDLRGEVESLLASYDDDPDYLIRPAIETADLFGPTDPGGDNSARDSDPERLGPYKIIERLGEGGMGAVYLAERDDDQYRKKVAIKLVKRGMDSEQILARFRAERQILAGLEHPGIARLLDGGLADDGRPYFVLEHIEGAVPIDQYCDQNALGLQPRIRLFRQVCAAVQYAHQKLIVHRDLKPSNLLVSQDGEVKLLDFGIAKLLDPVLADVTELPVTQARLRPMTPEYASPEQVRGESLSTSSDVYTLGVVLYGLLTGQKPYRNTENTPRALAKAIPSQDPEKPSTAALRTRESAVAEESASPLEPAHLRGDLDNIVMMALRKDPETRYASVEALSQDLRAYLDKRPVLARPQTTGYRLGRFLQRNAGGVAAVALIAFSILAGLVGTAWQARVARAERDRARTEAVRSERVTDVMVDLFDLSDPVRNADADKLSVRDFADLAEEQVTTGLVDQPEMLAKLQTAIGRVNINLGRPAEAVRLLEEALEGQRRSYSGSHLDVATTLHWLSRAKEELGELQAAETLSREALSMRRELLGEEHPAVAETFNRLGNIVGGRGDLDDAEASFQKALEIRRQILGEEHKETAESLGSLAVIFYERGDYDRSEEYLRQAILVKERVLGPKHSQVAEVLNDLGAILYAKQDFDGSLNAHKRALSIRREILGEDHPEVAFSLAHIGNVEHLLGDTEAAVKNLERSLEIREAALGAEHPTLAFSLKQLGGALTTRGDYERADRMLTRSLEIDRRVYGNDHPLVANGLNKLGRVYSYRGQWSKAESVLREALRIRSEVHGARHLNTAATQRFLARVLLGSGNPVEAEELLASSLSTYEALFPEGHLFSTAAHLIKGDLLVDRGESSGAMADYTAALELRMANLPTGHWLIAEAQTRIAEVWAELGKTSEARALLEAHLPSLREQVSARHPSTKKAETLLAGLAPSG